MSDHFIEYENHPKWKKFLYGADFLCLMIAGFLMVFSLRSKSANTPNTAENGVMGSVTPVIMVDNTVYYWTGMSLAHTGSEVPGAQVSAPGNGSTYLPDGYTEYGSFLATVDTSPVEDLQMQADFSAFGTVYRNPETPEVVYVLMTTDWFESKYVRFATTEIYPGSRIFWNGRHYVTTFTNGLSAPMEAFPEGAVSIGTLHFIGLDRIPQKDLETNCLCDNFSYSLEGREVFADPANPDCIYVYANWYNSSGSYGVYWECPLWTVV